MKSPFPGMDPFIESCGLWGDFHMALIAKIKDSLADVVSDRYLVRGGERWYLELMDHEAARQYPFIPDVDVSAPAGRKRTRKNGSTAVAERAGDLKPVYMRAFITEEHREAFIEIREVGAPGEEHRLVTGIEVLSPSNKRPGSEGWDQYQRKRQSMMLGGVNLVEIDLLRGGQRMPMLDPWPASPYTILVARAFKEQSCLVCPATFKNAVPAFPVPLARPDPDVYLDVQPMIESIYQRSRYERSIDYQKPLKPAPNAEDAVWLQRHLRAHKKPV